MKLFLLFIIGLTALTSLRAEDQKIDIVFEKQTIRGKIGETVKIHFEAVNNTTSTLVIRNIYRTQGGIHLNNVSIRDGNSVYSSHLSGTWDTRKKSPQEDVHLKPKEKLRLYVPWKIKADSTLNLKFEDRYNAADSFIQVRVSE